MTRKETLYCFHCEVLAVLKSRVEDGVIDPATALRELERALKDAPKMIAETKIPTVELTTTRH